MSSYAGGDCCPQLGYCEAILRGIEMVNGINNTSMKPTPVGTIQALLDPINTIDASYQEDVNDRRGPHRKVRVKRLQRKSEEDAATDLLCDTTTTSQYEEECIILGQKSRISFTVTNEELVQYCADASQIVSTGAGGSNVFKDFLDKLQSNMNGLRMIIDKTAVELLDLNAGINQPFASNATQTLGMIGCVNGEKIEKGIADLVSHMGDNETYGQFLVTGKGNFDRFNTSAQWGCCNQFGLNWDAMNQSAPYRYYQDVNYQKWLLDSDRIFVLAPGATQFVYTNETLPGKGNIDRRMGTSTFGLLPDPYLNGVVYDLMITESVCVNGEIAPEWQITLFLKWDLAFIPLQAYAVTDRLFGTNGIYKYTVACV